MAEPKREDSRVLRGCLRLVHALRALVPSTRRQDWEQEWEAELRHHVLDLNRQGLWNWRSRMNLLRRALGALPDAASLRRAHGMEAGLLQDLRLGLRLMVRNVRFSAFVVLVLAVGIGANAAIFSVLDRLLLRPLPYPEPERIVTLWQRDASQGDERDAVAPANFLDWRERAKGFETLAAAQPWSFDYTGGGEPEVLYSALVTEGFFEAFGVRPALGRLFLPEEYEPGRDRVVALSHRVWRQRFGGAADVVGRTIGLDGEPYTVLGVLPPGFEPRLLPGAGERGVWAPKKIQEHERQIRESAWWNVAGRLKPGVTLEQAQREMDAISAHLAQEHPRTNGQVTALVQPLREHLVGKVRPALLPLAAAVAMVLLIACANVASLLLARGTEREREFAIRAALGAGRGRLIRQMLAESVPLALLSCAGGLLLAHWGLGLIVALSPGELAVAHKVSIDGRVAGFALGLSALTSLAFGLTPWARLSHTKLEPSIRATSATTTASASRGRLRSVLVVAEVALALVLLAGAGLLLRSFARLMEEDPGFERQNMLALQVFAWDRNQTPERRAVFFERTLERIAALSGVEAAGAVSALPFIPANIGIQSPLAIEGRPAPPEGEAPLAYVTVATSDYFRALNVPLRQGRLFDRSDGPKSRPVAVISETLSRRHWPGGDPVGRRITVRWHGEPLEAEVAGVVGPLRHDGLRSPPRAEVFVPHAQVPFGSMTYVVRTRRDAEALMHAAKEAIWAEDPLQAFYQTTTMEQLVAESVRPQRFSLTLLGAFAALALVLAAAGIFGVMSFTAEQRKREIGIRIALGARGRDILRLLVGEGMALALLGIALGLCSALGLSRFLSSLLHGVEPTDPPTLAAVCALLGAVALAACYLPARRALRNDPISVLRIE